MGIVAPDKQRGQMGQLDAGRVAALNSAMGGKDVGLVEHRGRVAKNVCGICVTGSQAKRPFFPASAHDDRDVRSRTARHARIWAART